MSPKIALASAAIITALVMVLTGGITAFLVAQKAPPAVATAATTAPAQAGLDPVAVQALLDQRDQAYQQQIEEANHRLADANNRLQDAYARLAAAAATPASVVVAQPPARPTSSQPPSLPTRRHPSQQMPVPPTR